MKEIQIKDNVKFSDDPYFKILMQPEEILYWSGESLKINRRGTTQKRIFILTNQRVVNVGKRGNFLTNMFSSLVKREIHVEDIAAITYSLYSNHFVLHVPSEYDYLLCSRQRNEFIERLIQLKENREDPLMIFFFVEQINLLPFCQLEGQKETKWPKETKNVLNLQSFQQLMEKRRKTVEVSVENTEMIMSNDGQDVNEQSFEVLKVLGKGFFGNVFLVEKKDDKKLFALKVISKLDVLKKKFLDNIKNEKIILEKIKHPFVVQMEYCFASPSHIFFAMEFMQGGELYRHLKKMSKFPENTAKFYAAQILSGLSYLHSNNIMYRDMKPENILLDNKGNIALADFGISKILNPQDMTKSFVGTPEYVAPEIILQKGHNKNVDVWCFGILLYEMIFGVPPFYNKSQTIMLNWIVTIDPFFPKMIEISDELKDLISKCLTKNPEERIGHENIDEIKSHQWFSDINWEDLEALKYDPPIKPDIKNKTDLQNFNKKYANQPAVIKKIKEQDLNYVNENKEKFKDFQLIINQISFFIEILLLIIIMINSLKKFIRLSQKNTKKPIFITNKNSLIKRPYYGFNKNNQNEDFLYKQFKKFWEQQQYKIKHMYRKNKIYIWLSIACIILYFYIIFKDQIFVKHMSYTEFIRSLEYGQIDKVVLNQNQEIIFVYKSQQKYILKIISIEQVQNDIKNFSKNDKIEIQFIKTQPFYIYKDLTISIIQISALIFFGIYVLKKDKFNINIDNYIGLKGINKSKAKKFSKESNINITFKDVAGIDNVKSEIEEFVDFLKNPQKFKSMGAKIPKGALLYGPPGTGKTLLAKACAGEAGVNFYYTSGSEFVEMYVGVGASRVRDLFKEAKENAPAIIFIDEIDAIGKKRSQKFSSNSEQDSTLNQLLVEMDGFTTQQNVIVFGATNRKDILDQALIRPGRLDRQIQVSLPDLKGREQIFKVHLQPIRFQNSNIKDYIAKRMSSLTPGFSGADIAQVCNEAAIQAVRSDQEFVNEFNFELAIERVIGGIEKKVNLNFQEEQTVAIHESGHGVIAWFLEGADPLLKLTIIPRSKGALGFAQYLPKENALIQEQELKDKIISILAGRVSELEFFGEVTTGAYDDFQKAYNIAHAMVTKYGMSNLGYVSLEEDQSGYRYYSEKTNQRIDEEQIKCKEMVKIHKDKIQQMSQVLLDKKTIEINDILKVVGERPFKLSENFSKYVEGKTMSV